MATAASPYPSWLSREERLAGRVPSGVAARIGKQAVQVTDVSELGCRVRMEVPDGIGTFLTLSLGDASVTGWVAWRRGDELGLDFSQPLDAATLAVFTGTAP